MRNIHILPADSPSRVYRNEINAVGFSKHVSTDGFCISQNIYITSDEEIKEGDWSITLPIKGWTKPIRRVVENSYDLSINDKKIILTTDQDLIKDGVQAIGDKFLEWFVKNPSCEGVEYDNNYNRGNGKYYYKIIIPKEDLSYTTNSGIEISDEMVRKVMIPKEYFGERDIPKQETLEEAAQKFRSEHPGSMHGSNNVTIVRAFINGAKWQQESSKQDLKDLWDYVNERCVNHLDDEAPQLGTFNEWFEQFKKK